ncbi:hypothetical protein [Amycolatopsis sp. NPDC051372]|uniref:hypothetical protein n=1 Tax=unclassified Amycolatopsis TaxID=2618356 RepID=UPI003413C166
MSTEAELRLGLARLVGARVTDVGRTVNMVEVGFAIGDVETRLHAQCPFRFVGGDTVLLGSEDLAYPAPPPLLSAARRDLPRALDDVVSRGMAKDPADRHPTAGAFAAAVNAALAGTSGPTATSAETSAPVWQRGSLGAAGSGGSPVGGAPGSGSEAGGAQPGGAGLSPGGVLDGSDAGAGGSQPDGLAGSAGSGASQPGGPSVGLGVGGALDGSAAGPSAQTPPPGFAAAPSTPPAGPNGTRPGGAAPPSGFATGASAPPGQSGPQLVGQAPLGLPTTGPNMSGTRVGSPTGVSGPFTPGAGFPNGPVTAGGPPGSTSLNTPIPLAAGGQTWPGHPPTRPGRLPVPPPKSKRAAVVTGVVAVVVVIAVVATVLIIRGQGQNTAGAGGTPTPSPASASTSRSSSPPPSTGGGSKSSQPPQSPESAGSSAPQQPSGNVPVPETYQGTGCTAAQPVQGATAAMYCTKSLAGTFRSGNVTLREPTQAHFNQFPDEASLAAFFEGMVQAHNLTRDDDHGGCDAVDHPGIWGSYYRPDANAPHPGDFITCYDDTFVFTDARTHTLGVLVFDGVSTPQERDQMYLWWNQVILGKLTKF